MNGNFYYFVDYYRSTGIRGFSYHGYYGEINRITKLANQMGIPVYDSSEIRILEFLDETLQPQPQSQKS